MKYKKKKKSPLFEMLFEDAGGANNSTVTRAAPSVPKDLSSGSSQAPLVT